MAQLQSFGNGRRGLPKLTMDVSNWFYTYL
jgi:hypothetical protein